MGQATDALKSAIALLKGKPRSIERIGQAHVAHARAAAVVGDHYRNITLPARSSLTPAPPPPAPSALDMTRFRYIDPRQ